MKFQNPSLIFFLTDRRTHTRTDKPKPICSHFLKVGGIKSVSNNEFTALG